mgnify:CR=1 FL=1
MARCAWNPTADVDEALADFCEAAYPGHGPEMAQHYRDQDGAYRLVLDLHDLVPAPRRDVLDFSSEPSETMRTKVGELSGAAALLGGLYERIRGLGADSVAGELQQAELVWHVVEHLARRMAAWEVSLRDGDPESKAGHAAAAATHLEWLDDWERSANSPAYANLSRAMLGAMRYFTRTLA